VIIEEGIEVGPSASVSIAIPMSTRSRVARAAAHATLDAFV